MNGLIVLVLYIIGVTAAYLELGWGAAVFVALYMTVGLYLIAWVFTVIFDRRDRGK